MRLLLVEDDPMIGEAARSGLRSRGFTADWVQDGAAADTALATEAFDVLLLDLGLPKMQGLELLRQLRKSGNALPVLILTARDGTADKILGLDAGADDYMVKPYDLDELAARIRALLRRRGGKASPKIEHRGLVLDPATHQLILDGAEIGLSPREFRILHALLERPGQVLSRAQLEQRLYGWGEEVESNTIEVHLHGLRRKLGAGMILNVRGVGWRLAP